MSKKIPFLGQALSIGMAGYDLATVKDDGTWKNKLGNYGRIGGDLAGGIAGLGLGGLLGIEGGPLAIATGILGSIAGGYIGGKIGETAGEFIGSIIDFFSSGNEEEATEQFSNTYQELSKVSKDKADAFIRTGIKKYIEKNGSDSEEDIMGFVSSIGNKLPPDLKEKVFDIAKKEIIAA